MRASFLAGLAPDADFPSLLRYCRSGCDLVAHLTALSCVAAGWMVGAIGFNEPEIGAATGCGLALLSLVLAWVGDRDDWEFMRPAANTEGPLR